MKKIFSICLVILAMAQIARSQTSNITGMVKDEQGNPIRYVFVHDSKSSYATFTDSVGNFSVQANAGATLQFEATGHSDTTITVNKNTGLEVVLHSLSSGASVSSIKAQVTLTTQPVGMTPNDRDMGTLATGGTIAAIAHQKDLTHGNRYLFDSFVPGYVLSTNGTIVYNETYRFDYDKIGGDLLLTQDNNNVTQVPDEQIKTFSLFGTGDQLVTFEKVPAIDNKHYLQVLASGTKYSIYKSITTRLVKASYVNAGITTHGNNYDEFVDDIDYYFVDAKTNQPQKFNPKKKALKAIFAAEPDKINKYITDNSGDIDDAYLSKLGAYMNQ